MREPRFACVTLKMSVEYLSEAVKWVLASAVTPEGSPGWGRKERERVRGQRKRQKQEKEGRGGGEGTQAESCVPRQEDPRSGFQQRTGRWEQLNKRFLSLNCGVGLGETWWDCRVKRGGVPASFEWTDDQPDPNKVPPTHALHMTALPMPEIMGFGGKLHRKSKG